MKARIASSIAVAAGLLLVACAGTPRSKDAELAARIAYLESRLGAAEEAQKAKTDADAQRLAGIEGQLGHIVTLLEQPKPAAAAAPTPTPAPAAAPAPKPVAAVPPAEPPLVRRSEDFQFQGITSSARRMVADLTKKYEAGAKVNAKHFRSALVGRPLPQSRFIGPDGSIVDLNDLKGQKRLVLVFLRGFPGFVCPACSAQTIALMHTAEGFKQRNAQIVLVYPGAAESVTAFVDSVKAYEKDSPLPFPVLLDVNQGAVKAFDIVGALAKPTSIIADKDGIVRFAYVGESYNDRPSAETLLEALDKLPQ